MRKTGAQGCEIVKVNLHPDGLCRILTSGSPIMNFFVQSSFIDVFKDIRSGKSLCTSHPGIQKPKNIVGNNSFLSVAKHENGRGGTSKIAFKCHRSICYSMFLYLAHVNSRELCMQHALFTDGHSWP